MEPVNPPSNNLLILMLKVYYVIFHHVKVESKMFMQTPLKSNPGYVPEVLFFDRIRKRRPFKFIQVSYKLENKTSRILLLTIDNVNPMSLNF